MRLIKILCLILLSAAAVAGCARDGERSSLAQPPPTALIVDPTGNPRVVPGQVFTLGARAIAYGTTVKERRWDIAGGRTFDGESVVGVSFAEEGVYDVTFTVRDGRGARSAVDGRVITVGDPVPRNFALRFYGNVLQDAGRVKILLDDPATSEVGPAADIGAGAFTIEFWLHAAASDNLKPKVECGKGIAWINGNIVLDRDRYAQGRKYGVSLLGGHLAFGVGGNDGSDMTLCSRSKVADGQWHHVALTRDLDGAMAIFIDGNLDAAGQGPVGDISYPDAGVPAGHCSGPCVNSDPFLVIGAEKHDVGPEYPGFSGMLDELRLSTVVRYREPFTRPTSRFATDAATAALYHFDEGRGRVAADSAAAGRPANGILNLGGTPSGPEWVPSSAPTGP